MAVSSDAEKSLVWEQLDPALDRPRLDESLDQWTIDKKRRSHWNGHRVAYGQTFFLKWFFHGPLRAPARREWQNAKRLQELGIPTVEPAGWGRHRRGSFIVFVGSPGYPADQWRDHGVGAGRLVDLARTLATRVATLHRAHLCHRDLNVYHVLIHDDSVRLIDVGRVRPFRRRRWVVKDLASLLDTSGFEGLPASVMRSFFRAYLKHAPGFGARRYLLTAVVEKARSYRRHNEKHGR